MQRIIRKLDGLTDDNLTLANVRTVTLVRLPFHLSTGPIFQIVDPEDERSQIWFRNKLSVPHNADVQQEISQIMHSSPDDFLTDALIVNCKPELRPGEFNAIKARNAAAIGPASLQNPGFRFLNEVIAAHQIVRTRPYVAGLGASWPRMLTEREIFARILVEVVLLAEPERLMDKETVLPLIDNIDQLPMSLPTGEVGEIRDYTEEQITELMFAVRKLRNHAFYELKSNAVAAMLRDDAIVAIVLGCAALEGTHGAFMRLALRDQIPGDTGEFNKFVNGLLREQGFYSLVQLSVRVLMKAEERPSESELKQCLDGVTIRNAIMHASIKGTGKYKIRDFSRSEISNGYSGIMAVYRAFETAVESREQTQQAIGPLICDEI
jgi:hypothetical protein